MLRLYWRGRWISGIPLYLDDTVAGRGLLFRSSTYITLGFLFQLLHILLLHVLHVPKYMTQLAFRVIPLFIEDNDTFNGDVGHIVNLLGSLSEKQHLPFPLLCRPRSERMKSLWTACKPRVKGCSHVITIALFLGCPRGIGAFLSSPEGPSFGGKISSYCLPRSGRRHQRRDSMNFAWYSFHLRNLTFSLWYYKHSLIFDKTPTSNLSPYHPMIYHLVHVSWLGTRRPLPHRLDTSVESLSGMPQV